jgi:hypothetical protein
MELFWGVKERGFIGAEELGRKFRDGGAGEAVPRAGPLER